MPELNCQKCGYEIPSESIYCHICGSRVKAVPREFDLPLYLKEHPIITAALVCLLITLFIAFSMHGREKTLDVHVRELPSASQSPTILAPITPPAQDKAVHSDESTAKTDKPQPPSQVIEYLGKLEKVDGYRQSMQYELLRTADQLRNEYASQNNDDASVRAKMEKPLSDGYADYARRYAQLISYFNTMSPPAECEQLGKAYKAALSKGAESRVQSYYYLTQFDLSESQSILDKAQPEVVNSLFAADNALDALCTKYGMKQQFSINQAPLLD